MKKILTLSLLFVTLGVLAGCTPKEKTVQEDVLPQVTQPEADVNSSDNWVPYIFDDVGLTFSVPAEMTVTGEKLDDNTFTLYVQRSEYAQGEEYYQLYGLYNLSAREAKLEEYKSGLVEDSITEHTVSGFPAISGQYEGERNRFVTIIITDRGVFTLATAEPTEENRKLSESIIETFVLK